MQFERRRSELIADVQLIGVNDSSWPFPDLRNAKPNDRNEIAKRTLEELTGYSLLEPWYIACDTKLVYKLLIWSLIGPLRRIRIK
jgi:hypothetical protein